MAERLAKLQKCFDESKEYIDCQFVTGSAAEVDCIFSKAKFVFSSDRRAMTPRLFEALIFLKHNE